MKPFLAAAFLFAAVAPLHAQAPDPNQMIRNIRLSATLQEFDLNGVIRGGGKKFPIGLAVREENMQFNLGNGERFHIRLGDEKAELFTVEDNGKTTIFPSAKLVQRIAGTDVTYEDLTLRFLYWPNAKLEGEENANGADCYKIRLNNPGGQGAFGSVYVWVHKKYGAFWQIRAHDRTKEGNPIKEFLVSDVMQLPGKKAYTVKSMRVNSLEKRGGENRTKSVTYIDFENPKKRPPAGPKR
jgi:hypothetical protein